MAWPGLLVFQDKAKLLYDGAELNYPTLHGVVVRRAYAAEHPEVLGAFLQAQLDATDFLNQKPLDAAKIVADGSGLPQEVVYLYNGPGGTSFDTTLKPALDRGAQRRCAVPEVDRRLRRPRRRPASCRMHRCAPRSPPADRTTTRRWPRPRTRRRSAGPDPVCNTAVNDPTRASELWLDGADTTQPAADTDLPAQGRA